MTEHNRYAPPQAEVRDPEPVSEAGELASRWARLGGSMLDGLVLLVLLSPVLFFSGYWESAMAGEISLVTQLGYQIAGFVTFAVVNGYLLATAGQTVGKRLVGTRIVRVVDEQRPTLGNLLGVRYAMMYLLSAIPLVGGVVGIIDSLLIFREDRRCLHDLVAGTKVIRA